MKDEELDRPVFAMQMMLVTCLFTAWKIKENTNLLHNAVLESDCDDVMKEEDE